MSEENVKRILRECGLTEKEMAIYIFLAKQGISKGGDLTKQTKTPKAHAFWKNMNSDNPAGQNTHLLKKDEIEIRIHGNTLFANWSVPIFLYPKHLTLPTSCILIEEFGEVKTTAYTVVPPSGYRVEREENYLDVFVTFFHPSTKYSGPGTD